MEWKGLEERALRALAVRVAHVLRPGDTLVLDGEVGAGKTAFVRAAAEALNVEDRVTSPTYGLARSYEGATASGPVRINHLDLYRLEGVEDRDALELDDYLDPSAITFIEWADPVLDLLDSPTVLRLWHETPTTRAASLTGPILERLRGC